MVGREGESLAMLSSLPLQVAMGRVRIYAHV